MTNRSARKNWRTFARTVLAASLPGRQSLLRQTLFPFRVLMGMTMAGDLSELEPAAKSSAAFPRPAGDWNSILGHWRTGVGTSIRFLLTLRATSIRRIS